ncbi:MAG: hypothetical protein ACTHN0_18645 [Aquihabitans sp.]
MSDAQDDGEVVGGGVVLTRLSVPGSSDSVVLLDPNRRPEGVLPWHPYRNLLRVTAAGDIRWRAELVPDETTAKCWTAMAWGTGLTAVTYSYECELDADTGRIIRATFTK